MCICVMLRRMQMRLLDEHPLSWLCMVLTSPLLCWAVLLLCFPLYSLTLHPLTPLCFPFCYPQFPHTGLLFSDRFLFCLSLHYWNHQSHHSWPQTPLSFLFFLFIAVPLWFSFLPLFLSFSFLHSGHIHPLSFLPVTQLGLDFASRFLSAFTPLPPVLSWFC